MSSWPKYELGVAVLTVYLQFSPVTLLDSEEMSAFGVKNCPCCWGGVIKGLQKEI